MKLITQPGWPVLRYLQIILFSAIILYFGKTLFIPLFLGLLIAIVMYPVCKWFEKHGWSRYLAIAACLLIITLLFSSLFILLAWQLNVFSEDAPAILSKLEVSVQQMQTWMSNNIGVATDLKNNWVERFSGTIGSVLQSTLQTTINTLFILFLTPVYTALFMYHRKTFVQYIKLITPGNYQHQLDNILQQTIHTYFNYIKGMVLVYLIVGILNSIGLFALGVKHPVLFGMLCAIMTIIPYIGIFISALLPISVVWLETGNILYPVGVIAVFSFVQYLEANVIFPKVVGTQLHVSTFAMLVAIIAGGIVWGVSGMILFIPFVAILKIISDNIEEWKPINVLLSRR
ncbi:AI-2E family transporter [Panacibacter ginsenosidivorans]|uniref:AI-2E family transporter n=2 Tax=Panacibacter ginsenosidivorans TaxID=1813871 RepID=A0A5B8VEZ8_9BACT|nr:AI-2E family transporter [Panacibacter ginsenosidivorans]